jgi:hypothetical protein
MKPALIFALGALGLLALANRQKSTARARRAELPLERIRRPKARRIRFRHGTSDGLLDLNSATLFELKELAGMADGLAEHIIENRPYMTKIDLIGRRVIPDAAYEMIKHSITVAHAA